MFLPFISFAAIASAIVVNKMVLQQLPLIFYVGFRTLLAGLVLLAISHWRSRARLHHSYLRADLVPLLTVAVLTTLVPALLKAYGIKYLVVGKAALIGSLDPFVTALYAYLLFSERLTLRKWLGIGIAFIGTLGLCFTTSVTEQTLHAFWFFSWPELAAFGAVVLGRYGWLMAQKLLKAERYSPFELNGITMVVSGILGLVGSLLVDGWAFDRLAAPSTLWALIAYSVLVGNVFGFTAYGFVLKRHSANFAALAGFSTPVFITLFGWLILSEQITASLVLAGAVIFAGVYLFYREEVR